jgi:hypothetical protein
MSSEKSTTDACMDPWCVIRMLTGDDILFGFAIRHPRTGGLSWLRGTPIQHLDDVSRGATTASGRHYRLGRRIELEDIPWEGEEAWLAFDLLVRPQADHDEAVAMLSAHPEHDAQWVAACKMARHLRIDAPSRIPVLVQRFIQRYLSSYFELRALGNRN